MAVLRGPSKATATRRSRRDRCRVPPQRRGPNRNGRDEPLRPRRRSRRLCEYLDWRPYEYFTCRLSPVEAEGIEPHFVGAVETYEFNELGDGRTEHRWLLRCSDRSPEGLRAFAEKNADLIDFATQPWWGDQMRNPIAQDAEMYGLDEPDTSQTPRL